MSYSDKLFPVLRNITLVASRNLMAWLSALMSLLNKTDWSLIHGLPLPAAD